MSNWGEAIVLFGAAKSGPKVELGQIAGQMTIDEVLDERFGEADCD